MSLRETPLAPRPSLAVTLAIMTRFLTPHAAALPSTVPFTGPETLERQSGRPFRARLGANESLFGPSPQAIAAMEQAAAQVWHYADPESHDLKAALAAHHGCTPAHITVGGGIDTLFGTLCRLTLDPGTAVVTSLGAYPTFNFHVAGCGGALTRVPYVANHEDPQSLLDAARQVLDARFRQRALAPEAVAAHLGVSVRQLHMLFEPTGSTFHRTLNGLRVAEARRRLVEEPDGAIAEIAFAAGFDSLPTFYRVFRALDGHTPGDYRR